LFFPLSAPQTGVCGIFYYADAFRGQTTEAVSLGHIIFLFGCASRPENDIGSSLPAAPRTAHVAAADFK